MNTLFTSVFIALCAVNAECLLVCYPGFCDDLKSGCSKDDVIECNGPKQVVGYGFCGCCKECHTILDENETCSIPRVIGGPPQKEYCGEGLYCDENERKCKKQSELIAALANKE